MPHLAQYTASKFATVGYSETLHAELRSKGIRVTTVNPGLMRTGSYANAMVVGKREEEYRWFSLSASIPGLAHLVEASARKIYRAVIAGRGEIEVGMDAYLAGYGRSERAGARNGIETGPQRGRQVVEQQAGTAVQSACRLAGVKRPPKNSYRSFCVARLSYC